MRRFHSLCFVAAVLFSHLDLVFVEIYMSIFFLFFLFVYFFNISSILHLCLLPALSYELLPAKTLTPDY